MTCFVICHPSSLEKGLKNWKKKFTIMENVDKIGNNLKKREKFLGCSQRLAFGT